jgi:MFS transporter
VTVAPSQLTEGLAWVSTALNVGVSVGSLLAGQAADAGGSRAAYLAVAGFAWTAVVAGTVGLPALRLARTTRPLAAH